MSQEMKITIILIAMVLSCTSIQGRIPRYQRRTHDLRGSYLVHFNNKGEPMTVSGFEDFVRVLNRQRATGPYTAAGLTVSSFAENPEFPPLPATSTTVSELMTTTEPTIPHQPKPLATGTSRTLGSVVTGMASPGLTHVTSTTTSSPLKLPHEMSGPSPMAEASVSTNKPTLTLALGHDAATSSDLPDGPTLTDVSNLVTPSENSPSKITLPTLKLSHGSELTTKLISLQPAEIRTILNYAPSSSLAIRAGYNIPASRMTYVHGLPAAPQSHYPHFVQPETIDYGSHTSKNIAIEGSVVPLQIVRQEPSLIDIGQGSGQGWRSAPQEVSLNLGGWGGVDYHGHRSGPVVKPVLSIANLGYTVPASSHALSKVCSGPFFSIRLCRKRRTVISGRELNEMGTPSGRQENRLVLALVPGNPDALVCQRNQRRHFLRSFA